MSQHSEKKIVINEAHCFPALYLNGSTIGALPLPLLPTCSGRSPGPWASGTGARLAHQHILAAPGSEGGVRRSGGGGVRAGQRGFLARAARVVALALL